MNLRSTASFTICSRPTTLSGSTADFGKNWSRVRFAISTGMPTNSAYVLSAAGSSEYIQSIVSRYAFM